MDQQLKFLEVTDGTKFKIKEQVNKFLSSGRTILVARFKEPHEQESG
jgi:hypothetical protein